MKQVQSNKVSYFSTVITALGNIKSSVFLFDPCFAIIEEKSFPNMENNFPILSTNGGKSLSPFNGITKKLLIDWGVKITNVKLNEVTILFVRDFVEPLDNTDIVFELK